MHEGKIAVRGNLGADPVARFTAGGRLVVDFRLAATELSRRGGVASEATVWYRCLVTGELAELAKGLRKGDRIGIVGVLHERSWTRYGHKKVGVELHVSEITTDRLLVPAPVHAMHGGNTLPRSPLEAARAAGLFGDDPAGQD